MKKSLVLVLFIFLFVSFSASAMEPGEYKSAILIESSSGKLLYEYKKDEILPQASITKLMTYFVIRDFIESRGINLEEKIKIDLGDYHFEKSWVRIGLRNGEYVTLQDLIVTMMVYSANDSALQLEKYYNLNNPEKNFIEEMNLKAKILGMKSTVYVNSTGLTENNLCNFTTAQDTATLVSELIKKYPDLINITKTQKITYKGQSFYNWNPLLGRHLRVDGLKTGTTDEAGYCLVATEDLTNENGNGKAFRLVGVVLGAPTKEARLKETSRILTYGEINYENKIVVKKNTVYRHGSEYYKGGYIEATVNEDVYDLIRKSDIIEVTACFEQSLPRKIIKGNKVGTVNITNITTNSTIEETLYASGDFESISLVKRFFLFLKSIF